MSNDVGALLERAMEARRHHNLAGAKELIERALRNALTSGDQPSIASAYKASAQIERDLDNHEESLELYRHAAEILRTLNDPFALAHTLRHLGDVLVEMSRANDALQYYEQTLELYGEHSSVPPLERANTLAGFARANEGAGNREDAIALWKQAKALYAEVRVEAGTKEAERRLSALTKTA